MKKRETRAEADERIAREAGPWGLDRRGRLLPRGLFIGDYDTLPPLLQLDVDRVLAVASDVLNRLGRKRRKDL